MFISWQTYESLQITTYSIIELVRFLLSKNVRYVFTEKFCQDPLENYFGRQRSMGRYRDNPNIQTFGYHDNTIRTAKTYKPISTGNSKDFSKIPFRVCNEPVNSRKKKPAKKETAES